MHSQTNQLRLDNAAQLHFAGCIGLAELLVRIENLVRCGTIPDEIIIELTERHEALIKVFKRHRSKLRVLFQASRPLPRVEVQPDFRAALADRRFESAIGYAYRLKAWLDRLESRFNLPGDDI